MLKNCTLIILSTFFLFGCSISNQKKMLIGIWENPGKVLEFTETEFISINKDAISVLAFKGTYSFAKNPRNAIKMRYLEFAEPDGFWTSLKGTDLESFVDVVLFTIKDDTLQIKALGNDKVYTFRKYKGNQ